MTPTLRQENPLAQDQRSLTDQLKSLVQLANLYGHYDAADWIEKRIRIAREAYTNANYSSSESQQADDS